MGPRRSVEPVMGMVCTANDPAAYWCLLLPAGRGALLTPVMDLSNPHHNL